MSETVEETSNNGHAPVNVGGPLGQVRTLNTMMRALESVLVSRAQLGGRSGITYNGRRDLFEALGYDRTIDPTKYRDRFARNGVAGRVVEIKPQSTWRGGGELVEDEDPETVTDFEMAWTELDNRLKVWNILERADTLAGLGRYAVVLIGAPGALDQQVTRATLNEIYFLAPFAEDDAPIIEYETNIHNERFGQATYYNLKRIRSNVVPSGTALASGGRVHWSRCLHVADGLLDDIVYGTPRLERVWNLLDDLEKVTGGGAEAYWMRADRGMQFDLDKEMDISEEEKKKMRDQIEEFTHELRRFLTTRGVTVNELGSEVSDFKTSADAIIDQIAAAISVPQRILMGAEAGHLASTQDQENWAQRIRDRRRQYAEPLIVRPFADRLIKWGALPTPKQYRVNWLELDSLGQYDRARIGVQMSSINKNMGSEVITSDELRQVMDYPPLGTAPKKIETPTKAQEPTTTPQKGIS